MLSSKSIMKLGINQLRRNLATQQVRLAEHNRAWAGSQGPDYIRDADEALTRARRIRREVYQNLRQPNSMGSPNESGDQVAVGICMSCGENIWAEVESLGHEPPRKEICSARCFHIVAAGLTGM